MNQDYVYGKGEYMTKKHYLKREKRQMKNKALIYFDL